MKISLTYGILLVLVCLVAACNPYYYSSNVQVSPLFKEKGEARVNANILLADGNEEPSVLFNGLNVQGAYAFTNHWGAFVNLMSGTNIDDKLFSATNGVKYGELALGYFKPVGESEKFIFEVYGGYGKGVLHNNYSISDATNTIAKIGVDKLFIQPGIGLRKKNIEISMTTRVTYVANDFKTAPDYAVMHDYDIRDYEYALKNKNPLYLEPAFNFRVGGERLKFNMNFVRPLNVTYSEYKQQTYALTFGIQYAFNLKKSK